MSSLPRSIMDTDLLPQKQRISAWRDSATSVWDISAITSGRFRARVDAFHAHELVFGTIESTSQRTIRTSARIGADGLDYYLLQFYLQGSRSAGRNSKDAIISEGDLLVVDMTQPILTESNDYKSIDLVIPRRVLSPYLRDPDAHGARHMDGSLPLVSLLRSHLQAMYLNAPKLTQEEAFSLQGPTVALAAAALNGMVLPEHAAPAVEGMRMAILRHIEDNLADLTLSAESTAAQFAISRATLYRMMEQKGGFVAYLRQRRLRRCRDDITDPAQHYRSISDIAAQWGFPSPSAFSTAFQRHFGLSPRDCRHFAFTAVAANDQSAELSDWSRWLSALK